MPDAIIKQIDRIKGTVRYCLDAINPFQSLITAVLHEEDERPETLSGYVREARDTRMQAEKRYAKREAGEAGEHIHVTEW